MEISLRKIKELFGKKSEIYNLALSIDKNGEGEQKADKIINGKEIIIFETEIAKMLESGQITNDNYKSIWGFNIEDKACMDNFERLIQIDENQENTIISDNSVKLNLIGENNNNEYIGKIIFLDENGEEKNLKISIDARLYNDKNRREAYLNSIVSTINMLPQKLKTDLFNEINELHLVHSNYHNNVGETYTRVYGFFTHKESEISLILPAGQDLYDTLTHELGHALSEKNGDVTNREKINTKIYQLRRLLESKGINIEGNSLAGFRERAHYMFKPDEFIPEYTSYLAATSRIQNSNNIPATTNIPGSMQFIHELATSQDPEIQRAFNEIVELYFEIIEESRLSTPAERKGNNNPDVIEERLKYDNYHFDKNADDPTYTAGANLMYSDIEGIYDFFEQDYAKLCRLYYEYKNNILTNDNAKRIFTELESSNNENWAIIKRHFENALESINAE